MSATVLDLAAARRWAVSSRALLSESRDEIDRLNVFPVPDGDTGTNMFLTVDGALATLRAGWIDALSGEPITLEAGLALLSQGMLLSARGNSGVILSQLARGMSEAVAVGGTRSEAMSASVLSDAFARAADVAWAGVSRPVEGTILSVARAAATGARQALEGIEAGRDRGAAEATSGAAEETYAVAAGALETARDALARTPDQLPRLAEAGVVDAGGAGFVLVLEALEGVLADRPHEGTSRSSDSWHTAAPGSEPDAGLDGLGCRDEASDFEGDGDYEVMYHLIDSDESRSEALLSSLMEHGSSVMVVGGPQVWRVHVHLDDPQTALDAGSRAGRMEQVSIAALNSHSAGAANIINESSAIDVGGEGVTPALGLLCCAPGPGLATLFAEAGATVVRSSAGNRASTGQLLQAARGIHANEVAILPNDPDTILAARAAAAAGEREGVKIHVLPTLAAVQGIAAVSVWSPGLSGGEASAASALQSMRSAYAGVAYASLTTASADASTPVGPCRQGQFLGIVGAEIVCVNDDAGVVADAVCAGLHAQVAGALEGGLPELLTLIEGAQAQAVDITDAVNRWSGTVPGLEVHHLEGGQRTYHWLLGLE